MEEFSEFVGLSRPTVSRFFQDPESVRSSTRQRIQRAVESSGYRPNLLAANLNRQKSKILGIVVPTLFDPFYMAITRRIDQIVTLHGFQAFTLSSDGKHELEVEAIKTFTSMNVAGSFIAPLGRKTVRSELRDIKKSMPLVALDSPLDDETSFVGTNNAQSMMLMVNYLCRSGEPPVYFDMPGINDNAYQRRKAYSESMKKLGHKPRYAFSGTFDTWDFEKFAFDQTTAILSQGDFASSTVLCANDRLAFGVLAASFQAGVKVGRGSDCRLRVAGHDNQPLSAYTCPPLTTVSQNYDDIGRIATEILLAKLGASDLPVELIDNQALLNGELELRESA
ncbi:MAG: LacI family DNA-binding transcriptional regulator [Rhodothermales bacterium]|nr:LacI family DNA-binding transcriptional regulator [Rhodothermales bacterium]